MKVKFTEDNELRKLPTRATEGSAAYDLYVPKDTVVARGRSVIPLGFCVELDPFTAGNILPRSGYASKGIEGHRIITSSISLPSFMTTCSQDGDEYMSIEPMRIDADVVIGLVDSDFRNEIGVIINNHDTPFLIKKGTRIAQMLIVPVMTVFMEVVDELSPSDRKGGFGSTN